MRWSVRPSHGISSQASSSRTRIQPQWERRKAAAVGGFFIQGDQIMLDHAALIMLLEESACCIETIAGELSDVFYEPPMDEAGRLPSTSHHLQRAKDNI